MTRDEFREALLQTMERKVDWAWAGFRSGLVAREKLHIHLEQEYATYVRDFPVLVARAYVACPHAEARRILIENVFEEETGRLHAGRPHPELFLLYPKGLGFDLSRFDHVALLPKARDYREKLDEATERRGWDSAAAVATIFLEGTNRERGELDASAPRRSQPPLEEHPLVVHYGLRVEDLALTKAHRGVEGSHRADAWRVVLDFVDESRRAAVVATMNQVADAWLAYRDEIAHACGLRRGPSGTVERAV